MQICCQFASKLTLLRTCSQIHNDGVWLSLVERYVRDVEAASSNLVTPTIMKTPEYSFPEFLIVKNYSTGVKAFVS